MKQTQNFFLGSMLSILFSCSSAITPAQSLLPEDLISKSEEVLLERNSQSPTTEITAPKGVKLSLLRQNQLDSIYAILKQDKEVLLDEKDRDLYEALLNMNLRDTTYLTNIYLKTPKDGSIKSYQYDVLEGDEVFYSIENLDGNAVEEISIVEGEMFRYVKQKFPKKSKNEGRIKIIDDNTLTLNINNSSFLKNKGIFGSKLKITLKKTSPLKILYEELIDSIANTETIVEMVYDTIYEASYVEDLKLAPILDITEKSQLAFPIDISPKGKELVGWGYWLALNNYDTIDWASDQDNDLINFATQEIFNSEGKVSLQNSVNENIKLKINNNSLDVRTLNYSGNYAFYLSDSKIEKPHRRAEIIIQNLSDIYSYTLKLGLVSVYFKPREVLVEKDFYTQRKRIKLTLGKDE